MVKNKPLGLEEVCIYKFEYKYLPDEKQDSFLNSLGSPRDLADYSDIYLRDSTSGIIPVGGIRHHDRAADAGGARRERGEELQHRKFRATWSVLGCNECVR